MPRTSKAKRRNEAELCLDLHVRGYSVREIAAHTGIPHATVHRRITEFQDELAPIPERSTLIRTDFERLEKLVQALYGDAETGDVKAVNALLRVLERRSKLLGLDEPQRTEITLTEGFVDQKIRELTEQLAAQGTEVDA